LTKDCNCKLDKIARDKSSGDAQLTTEKNTALRKL